MITLPWNLWSFPTTPRYASTLRVIARLCDSCYFQSLFSPGLPPPPTLLAHPRPSLRQQVIVIMNREMIGLASRSSLFEKPPKQCDRSLHRAPSDSLNLLWRVASVSPSFNFLHRRVNEAAPIVRKHFCGYFFLLSLRFVKFSTKCWTIVITIWSL